MDLRRRRLSVFAGLFVVLFLLMQWETKSIGLELKKIPATTVSSKPSNYERDLASQQKQSTQNTPLQNGSDGLRKPDVLELNQANTVRDLNQANTASVMPTPPPPTKPQPRSQSIADWFELWTGEPFSAEKLPIKANGTIPDRLFMTWKTKVLPPNAVKFWEHWKKEEPWLDFVVLDDKECAELATFFPDLKPRYDGLPLNVMRADVCRVLAIYYFGGYYKDLDVDWRRPLKHWIDPRDDIAYGMEDAEHLCQWFFAAKPGNPCVFNILQHITNLIANTSYINFTTNIEAVIDITGPGVWTDAMQGCPTPPKYTVKEMDFDNVYHDYASQRWKENYTSWIEERQKVGGLKEVWPAFEIQPYFFGRADEHLLPYTDKMPVVELSDVKQSSIVYGIATLSGPANAFDMHLETNIETEEQMEPFFEFTFAKPMTIGTFVNPDEDHLTGIRVFNRHREPGTDRFSKGMFMALYDKDNKLIHQTSKQGRMATHYLFNIAGFRNTVSRVKFFYLNREKKPERGVLTFAEIQIYSDNMCRFARRVSIKSVSATSHPSTPEVITQATTVVHNCPSARALTPHMGFQYSFCGDVPKSCTAYALTSRGGVEIDAAFVATMHDMHCGIVSVGPTPAKLSKNWPDQKDFKKHVNVQWCSGAGRASRSSTACDVSEQLVNAIGVRDAVVLYIDIASEEWEEALSLLSVLTKFNAHMVFVPMRLTPKVVTSHATVERLAEIRKYYDLYASHVNPGEGTIQAAGMTLPKELQLSFKGRASRPADPDAV